MKLSHADAPPSFQPGKPVGNVYYGACSWTDRTLIDAGTFYPGNARTAADRLAHYASQFPIVEVDATYYALPSERNAHLWVERTPSGFLFNIKAFGLFTHHPVVVERLPAAVKELLPAAIAEKSRVYLRDIPEEAEKLIWEMQAQALAPLAAAGKLGCVLFQFPHWFTARRAHIRYLEQLRDRSDWPLAIEFRGGGWMTGNYRAETLAVLGRLDLAYVVVDEPQGFRSSTPPVVAATSPLAVVRFHGHNAETYEKPNLSAAERFRYLYTEEELKGWVAPIRGLAEQADQVHVLMNDQFLDRPHDAIEHRISKCIAKAPPPAWIVTPAGHRGRSVSILVENDGAAQGYKGNLQPIGDGPSRHRDLVDDQAFDPVCLDSSWAFLKRYRGEVPDQLDGGAEGRNSALLADVAPCLGESTSRKSGFPERMKLQTCPECLGLRIEEAEQGHAGPAAPPGD